jgi:hypothetical protein
MMKPAFPTAMNQTEGLSLRDYFAAKVLQGMSSRDSFDAGQATPEQRARLAYIDADAMLKARESEQ